MVRSEAVVGRYALSELIGSGGMARVYVGRLGGWAGFSKAVAVKRLHPDLARDPEFSAMLLDEARLTAHIRHPNVVSTQDVVREDGEFLLVMDYVVGVSLDVLSKSAMAKSSPVPDAIVAAIACGILHGLHAAHEARDEHGKPLAIVHRDMSPPNVIVDESGVVKILDFGIATASDRLTTTKEGSVKGKPAYIAPEQLARGAVDRRADLYAVGVMLWELLAGRRLHADASFSTVREAHQRGEAAPNPSEGRGAEGAALGAIALEAMRSSPEGRFPTALAMANAIEAVIAPASPSAVASWCSALAPDHLRARKEAAVHTETGAAESTAVVGATAIESPHARDAATDRPLDVDPRPRRGRGIPIAVGALAFALFVAFGAALMSSGEIAKRVRGGTAEAHPSAAVASSVPPSVASAEPPAASPVVEPPPAATPPPAASPVRVHAPARPARGPKPASDCREPFRVDANGVKIPKRECL